jgi:hypothetical protein
MIKTIITLSYNDFQSSFIFLSKLNNIKNCINLEKVYLAKFISPSNLLKFLLRNNLSLNETRWIYTENHRINLKIIKICIDFLNL